MMRIIDMKKVSEFKVNGWALIVAVCLCLAISVSVRIKVRSDVKEAAAMLAEARCLSDRASAPYIIQEGKPKRPPCSQ